MEAVAFAGHFHNRGPMGEAVEGGGGEAFVAEDFGPVLESEVGGEDDTGPFVGMGDHIEQQFRPGLAGGDIAEFVEDEQVESAELVAEAKQVSVLVGLAEGGDEFDHVSVRSLMLNSDIISPQQW